MADFRQGSVATVALPQIVDSNGSPVTTGVTGTFSLYGPASTAAISAGSTLAHLGNGYWGFTFPPASLVLNGAYKANAATVAYGSVTLVNQAVLFTVGLPSPAFKTLRECVVSFYDELHDGLYGTATGNGSTSTLVDSARANSNLTADEYVDSELLFLAPGAVTDANPATVTSWTPGTGTFTFAPVVTSTTSGQAYLLCNLRGQGYPFRDVRNKILAAWRDVQPTQVVVDEVSATTDGTFEMTVPVQWRDITAVALRDNSSNQWEDIAPAYFAFDQQRRIVRFTYQPRSGLTVRLEGRVDYNEPSFLNSVVNVPYAWLRDRVLGELLAGSPSKGNQQRAAVHLQRAQQRFPRM